MKFKCFTVMLILRPKHVVAQLKRRIGQENPHVSLFALQVFNACCMINIMLQINAALGSI